MLRPVKKYNSAYLNAYAHSPPLLKGGRGDYYNTRINTVNYICFQDDFSAPELRGYNRKFPARK